MQSQLGNSRFDGQVQEKDYQVEHKKESFYQCGFVVRGLLLVHTGIFLVIWCENEEIRNTTTQLGKNIGYVIPNRDESSSGENRLMSFLLFQFRSGTQ